MKKQYHFVTRWVLEAPLESVWDAIYDSETWPEWWKGVISVTEINKGDEQGIGSVRVYKLSSPMHYTLRFSLLLTERIDYRLLKGKASGELEGTGAWIFRQEGTLTYVECHWQVATTIRWMNDVSFLMAPVFRYNHAIVMRWGARSLAKKLGCRLISC